MKRPLGTPFKKERGVLSFALFILLTLSLLWVGTVPGDAGEMRPGKVCIAGRCFSVELAVTEAERAKGLMFRESLAEDQGMLFIFPLDGLHGFWMRNTLIALDIIWMDRTGKIVTIAKSRLPCRKVDCPPWYPDSEARYVLEINAGLSERFGFAPGTQASLLP